MPQVEITREQIIVVDHSETDTYGNLSVTDKAGGKHKISAKRSQLGEFIIPGRAVKFQYASYMNKEYIANAILVETPTALPQPVKYPDAVPQVAQTPTKVVKEQSSGNVPSGQEIGLWWKHRAFALSYSKDLACSGTIEVKELYSCAEDMLVWLNKTP
jgi:hypothetical protein